MHRQSYYEAILQLRPKNKAFLDFVTKQIEGKKDVFVSKVVNLKTGIDIYLSSRKFAVQLGRKLKKSFKGELKVTKSLYSRDRQTGKLIYRVTVLFRQ